MNKVKPTKLQKRTLAILKENPGISLRKAMITAGYAEKTAGNPKQNLLEAPGVLNAREQWIDILRDKGITIEKLAEKQAEWLGAQKVVSSRSTGRDADAGTDDFIEVPDYQTQLKAGEMLREDFGFKQQAGASVTLNFNAAANKQREEMQILNCNTIKGMLQ